MKQYMKKIILLMSILTILPINSITTKADTLNINSGMESRTMYQWNTSVQLYGRQSTMIKGPAGNNYNFTTTNPRPEISYYSQLYIKSSEASNLQIYATDISTGKVYYALQSGQHFYISNLPKGTFRLTAKDTGTSGALRNINFYVESRKLVGY